MTARDRDRLQLEVEWLRDSLPRPRASPPAKDRLLVFVLLAIVVAINVVLAATGKLHAVHGRSTVETSDCR